MSGTSPTERCSQSSSGSSSSTLTGWVLHVNECLRDASGDSNKETNQSVQSGQSGQSGDEEVKAVAFEDSVVESAPSSAMETAETAVHHSRPSREAPADLYLDPCLFYSYAAGCAKGEECEYSHSIHADQVAVPEVKQRRGQARFRIKNRLNQHFAAQSLYEVHQELQQEARQGSYAKHLIRRHLTRIHSSTSARLATSGASAASAASGALASTSSTQ
mmetsp:Transcript_45984/g.100175  ORF Transcript_45984/g.100175 Transcript_45984/m.100175 type:complete len:218 (+) Transcript_45984:90-743(+)